MLAASVKSVIFVQLGILFGESPLDQPDNDREVLPLVVGRQDDRILVFGGAHCDN